MTIPGTRHRPDALRAHARQVRPRLVRLLLAEVGERGDHDDPSHPVLVPIERIAPGVPEDDDLIQEGALVR
jgi:hypothetical protein